MGRMEGLAINDRLHAVYGGIFVYVLLHSVFFLAGTRVQTTAARCEYY